MLLEGVMAVWESKSTEVPRLIGIKFIGAGHRPRNWCIQYVT